MSNGNQTTRAAGPDVAAFLKSGRSFVRHGGPVTSKKRRALSRGPKAAALYLERARKANLLMDGAITILERVCKTYRERWIFEKVLGEKGGGEPLRLFLLDVTTIPPQVEKWCSRLINDPTFQREVLASLAQGASS